MNVSKLLKKKEGKGVFTLKRNDVAREELKIRSLEVAHWLAATLDNEPMKTVQDSDGFFSLLQDGVILCQLIEKVAKDVSIKYRPEAKPQSFQARENITHFLEASKKVGVPSVSVFEADDLVARKNDKSVVNSLLQLSRVTAKKYNVEPPTMIKYELEIEEEQKKQEEGKEDKDEEDKDDIKEEEEKEEEESQDEMLLLQKQRNEEQKQKQKEDEEEEEAQEEEKESKVEIVELKQQNKPEKTPFTFLPYIPKKDNDIDRAVAKVLNENLLDVDVKQVQIKNKKRRRDTKHKAEYVIHGDRVHVRMLQGFLVVRVQSEWVNFVRFVQERLGFEDE
jgi:flagellar biosynthesis GTPase FlhF